MGPKFGTPGRGPAADALTLDSLTTALETAQSKRTPGLSAR
jgi:hypothetical protein